MSAETLQSSEMAAGRAIGLSEKTIETILEAQQTRVVRLGELAIKTEDGSTRTIEAWRGISGPDDGSMDKGGSRMTDRNPLGDLNVLPQDMWAKLHQSGLTDAEGNSLNGGKLLFGVNPNSLTHEEKKRTFAAAAEAMLEKGRAGHDKSVPAGDMGTNHTDYMDAFALRVEDSGDPFWQASITGKSPEQGGLEFRPHATGYGVYLAADYQRQKLGLTVPTRLTISGAGNVGGFAGYYASKDPNFSIRGYGDIYGTLYVEDEDPTAGIIVDETVLAIMDNPNFLHDERYTQYHGNKLAALRDVLERQQPGLGVRLDDDPEYVMRVETDIFIPASVRNLINLRTAPTLNARAITEAGNDTIGEGGYEILSSRGIDVIPGTIANTGGVATSMDEHQAGITGKTLSFERAKELATQSAALRFERMNRTAELLGTDDNNMAAAALGVAGMARQLGHHVSPDVAAILDNRIDLRVA